MWNEATALRAPNRTAEKCRPLHRKGHAASPCRTEAKCRPLHRKGHAATGQEPSRSRSIPCRIPCRTPNYACLAAAAHDIVSPNCRRHVAMPCRMKRNNRANALDGHEPMTSGRRLHTACRSTRDAGVGLRLCLLVLDFRLFISHLQSNLQRKQSSIFIMVSIIRVKLNNTER